VASAFQSVDRREELLPGEIPRGSKHHEEIGAGSIGWGLQRHGVSLEKPWSLLKLLRVIDGVVDAM
jgi:hypothetical protein